MKRKTVVRDTIDGRFVDKSQAKKRPASTVTETIGGKIKTKKRKAKAKKR